MTSAFLPRETTSVFPPLTVNRTFSGTAQFTGCSDISYVPGLARTDQPSPLVIEMTRPSPVSRSSMSAPSGAVTLTSTPMPRMTYTTTPASNTAIVPATASILPRCLGGSSRVLSAFTLRNDSSFCLTASRASANSSAAWYRLSISHAIAFRTTASTSGEMPTTSDGGGGGVPTAVLPKMLYALPSNGGRPQSMWYRITPKAYTSDRGPIRS